jgi:hypothetical protein
MQKLRVVIVSPALADANNGNWQTARRWQQLLSAHSARIVRQWPDAQADGDDVMLALHARFQPDAAGLRVFDHVGDGFTQQGHHVLTDGRAAHGGQ